MTSKIITACFLCFIGLFAANVKSVCYRDKLRVQAAHFRLERVDNQTDWVEHGWNLTAVTKNFNYIRSPRKNEWMIGSELMNEYAWYSYIANDYVRVVIIDVYFDHEMGPQHYRYLCH